MSREIRPAGMLQQRKMGHNLCEKSEPKKFLSLILKKNKKIGLLAKIILAL